MVIYLLSYIQSICVYILLIGVFILSILAYILYMCVYILSICVYILYTWEVLLNRRQSQSGCTLYTTGGY